MQGAPLGDCRGVQVSNPDTAAWERRVAVLEARVAYWRTRSDATAAWTARWQAAESDQPLKAVNALIREHEDALAVHHEARDLLAELGAEP